MNRDLAPRNPTSTAATRRPAVDPGEGADIAALTFEDKALLYERDMPTRFRKGVSNSTDLAVPDHATGGMVKASNVRPPRSERAFQQATSTSIASGLRQLDKPRRSGSRIVQRRIGWLATPESIVVTVAERGLEELAPGRLKPDRQGWLIERRSTHRVLAQQAQRRVGTVPADPATPVSARSAPTDTPDATQRAIRTQFPEGSAALSFLPKAVRTSVIGHVPDPTVFDGTVLQFSDPDSGTVQRTQVDLIRMNGSTAVVVQAQQKPNTTTWEVTQAVYRLGDPEVEQA